MDYSEIKTCHEDVLDEEIFEQRQNVVDWALEKHKHVNIVRYLMILEEERTRRLEEKDITWKQIEGKKIGYQCLLAISNELGKHEYCTATWCECLCHERNQ